MKILMLDIDGVLKPLPVATQIYDDHFSPSACKNLNSLLEMVPDLKIVISSAWRAHGIDSVKTDLQANGIDKNKVVDCTGFENGQRGYQIQCWLDRNPGVTNMVILDDSSDMCELMSKLVKTNPFVGLTDKNIEQAIEVLKTPLK